MGWKHYLRQREADEERRKKERANAEKKATALQLQAARFGAKATKAAAAHQMVARAERLLGGLDEVRTKDRVAKLASRNRRRGRTRSARTTSARATGRSRSSPPSTSRSTAAPRWWCWV